MVNTKLNCLVKMPIILLIQMQQYQEVNFLEIKLLELKEIKGHICLEVQKMNNSLSFYQEPNEYTSMGS